MQTVAGGPDFKKIAHKWHDLAERRLDYYTELYRSGRWQHYYTQDRFAMRMLDVIEAAKRWRGLAGVPRPERPARSSLSDIYATPEEKARRSGELRSVA